MLRELRPGAFAADPDACVFDAGRVGPHTKCALADVWVDCRRCGCYTAPDGSYVKPDNGPEACVRRVREMANEA